MGKSFEEQIKESLKDYQEQPSGNCWDSLSRQLDALHQVPASSQVQLAEGAKASMTRTAIGSTAAKIGLGTAVAGGLIAGGLLLFSPEAEESMDSAVGHPFVVLTDSLLTDSLKTVVAAMPQTTDATPSNTTFSESIPSYLLAESEDAQCSSKKEQIVPATDSTRGYTPQTLAGNTDKQPAKPVGDKTETPRNNTSEKVTADEEQYHEALLQPELRIPNVITPNGDNINDYFVIENLEMTEGNRLIIYNRYNKIIYERKNYGNNWNADNLPEGIYRYWLSFEYAGHEFMRQGSIRIIR